MTGPVPDPEDGLHVALAEFAADVRAGLYNDYEGSGYYATATEVSDEAVDLSAIDESRFTHVVWHRFAK